MLRLNKADPRLKRIACLIGVSPFASSIPLPMIAPPIVLSYGVKLIMLFGDSEEFQFGSNLMVLIIFICGFDFSCHNENNEGDPSLCKKRGSQN